MLAAAHGYSAEFDSQKTVEVKNSPGYTANRPDWHWPDP
jgi:hypothetical protein